MAHELFAFASTRRRMHEGPLGSLIDGFIAFLRARGHSESTARYQVRLAAALSRWLGRRKLGVRDLRRWTIDAFLRDRRRRVDLRPGDRFCLLLLLNHLSQTGILTCPSRISGPVVLIETTGFPDGCPPLTRRLAVSPTSW